MTGFRTNETTFFFFSNVSHLEIYDSNVIVYISPLPSVPDSVADNYPEFLCCCFCALMLVPLLHDEVWTLAGLMPC